MPEIWRKFDTNYYIIVWRSTEPITDLLMNAGLNDADMATWRSFKSESRKREWLTVRNVLKKLIPHPNLSSIVYDANGKPNLIGDVSISISHSNEFIAVMTSSLKRIGVDIEHVHKRIEKLSKKFVGDVEKRDLTGENLQEKLHVMWGAKEVLYKIHSTGGIDFRKDLFVHPFEYKPIGNLKASIRKRYHEKDYMIRYEKIGHYMLTWAVD